ncbi:hypothetical protein SEA_KEALII_55 [Arthrobacter phage KeAlii]|uniref:Lipoprotein n=1 Tax=Arthrobacter phage KeAlii TaxID=2885973 RepID=A0AA95B8P0_9CAUD|nr:hypothetical protein PQE15_gp55 [Arthrobacter phage KeAlii]UDL14661.1 hypothetical protein SEA_KEALII_55 [Arthrobacter phage KeAlii]
MKPNWPAVFALTALVIAALLLTGCDDGDVVPAAPADPGVGSYGPMLGMNGKIGFGVDLGNGISLNPATGGLGYGF